MEGHPRAPPESSSLGDRTGRTLRALAGDRQASRRNTRIAALRAELEAERDGLRRLEGDSSGTDHYDRALVLLDEADAALERDDPIASRWAVHSAQRLAVLGLIEPDAPAGGESEPGDIDPRATEYRRLLRRKKALELHVHATGRLSGLRKERFDGLLASDGEPRDDPDAVELAGAIQVLQEYYFARDLIYGKLKKQLNYFAAFAALALLVLLASALGNVFGPVLGDASDVVRNRFLVYVVLFGVLGASMQAIFSLSRRFVRGEMIETRELVDFPMALARVVAGGVSALVLFVVLQSGAFEAVFAFEFGAGLALALALAAGFSEELVRNALDGLSGRIVGGDGSSRR